MSRFFQRAKDTAIEKSVLVFLQPRLERFGEIRSFSLDTAAKTISGEILLRGDPVPVKISEARYRIEKKGDDTVLVIYGIKVSREWVQNLVDDFFQEVAIKTPDFVGLLG